MTKSNRLVFNIEKKKSHELVDIRKHNQRENLDDPKILKTENTHLNRPIYQKYEGLDTDKAVQLDIKNRVSGKKPRKDATVALEVLVSASPEYFRDDGQVRGEFNEEKMEAWVAANVEALKEKFGENLIRAELHLDESTPHIHAIVVPIQEKTLNKRRTKAQKEAGVPAETYTAERLDAKEMFTPGGVYDLSECHDFFAAAVEHLDIKRGLRGSRATHSKLKELDRIIQEAAEEAPRFYTKRKDPERKIVKGGPLKKDREEDDASYFKRAYELLKGWSSEQLGKANKLIRELSEALAVVNKQLEQEKKRTEAYAELVDDPEGLIELKVNIEQREEIISATEQRLDLREARLNERENYINEELSRDSLISDLRKKNQSLTRENEQLKESLNVGIKL
jgi:siroheme synthase (precorrin-2 oxidase/ferrochelatase)